MNMNNYNVYLIDYFKENKNNGLNTYVHELANGLANKKGIKLRQIWINSNYNQLQHKVIEKIDHFYIPKFTNSKDSKANFDIYFANLLAQIIGQRTNVIVHFNWINHCSIAWYLKQKLKCKIVLTKHCIPWRDFAVSNYKEFYRLNNAFNKRQKISLNSTKLQLEQINYEHTDHIITVTECAKDNLELFFDVNKDKISVVNNGIALNIPSAISGNIRTRLRKEYGFGEDEIILFFAGTLALAKGIVDLIEIFEEFLTNNKSANVRLVIAGSGNANILLQASKKYWSRITITGHLDKQNLYNFYQMVDIGIVPSYIEQCSYTAIEMMQTGLSVIVSDVDGLREIVPPGTGLRIKVDFKKDGANLNRMDLIEKLNLLLNNKAYAQQLGAKAREHALKEFNLEQMVNKTIEVYSKVLKEDEVSNEKSPAHLPFVEDSDMPLITILMPCFNAEAYLKSSIESVLNQRYKLFEFIIVDDCSSDGSLAVINSYKDKRIKVIRNLENKGVVYSLNKGLKQAKGKYIARIDADDIMLPNRLHLQVDFLEKNLDYGLVGAWHEVIDAYGKLIARVQPSITNWHLKLQLLFNNPFAHAAVTMRTELAKQFKYDKKYEHCEDYDLWMRIAAISKTTNLPHFLLQYRVHNSNTSGNNIKTMKKNVMILISRELDKCNIEHSIDELAIHLAISFGYSKVYFNTPEKIDKLNNWLNKFFKSEALQLEHDAKNLEKFKKHILNDYCYID